MGFIFYLCISLISFLGGIFFRSKKYINYYFIFVLVFPFTTFNTTFHVNLQIPFFIFFFIGGLIKSKYQTLKFSKVELFLILIFFIFSFYLIVTIPLYYNHDIINILKDLKFLIFGSILYTYTKINKIEFFSDKEYIRKAIKMNFFIALIMYSLMLKFNIHYFFNDDKYFLINEIRYLNYGIYVLPFFLVFLQTNNYKTKIIDYVFVYIPLLISGNRTLLFLITFVLAIQQFRYLSRKKIILFVSGFLAFIILAVTFIKNASENSALYRFKKILSSDYLFSAIQTRLSPLFIAFKDFETHEFIFGKGIGLTYFIPWFHYRTNIDDYNIYIDSLIPTLYGKYGIFFFLPLLIFFIALRYFSDYKSYFSFLLFFIILSLTNSFLYQTYLIILLFFIYYLKSLNKQTS